MSQLRKTELIHLPHRVNAVSQEEGPFEYRVQCACGCRHTCKARILDATYRNDREVARRLERGDAAVAYLDKYEVEMIRQRLLLEDLDEKRAAETVAQEATRSRLTQLMEDVAAGKIVISYTAIKAPVATKVRRKTATRSKRKR